MNYGMTANQSHVEIVHFRSHFDVLPWFADNWSDAELARAIQALENLLRPVVAISCYTWNTDEFLDLVYKMKKTVPELLVVAGGPQVQGAEEYLDRRGIDVIVIGEGEVTFQQLLDATFCFAKPLTESLLTVDGVAYLDANGNPIRTNVRRRLQDLDNVPSPLDVVALRGSCGRSIYKRVSYETSRGCPYRCSFCEWGTGAIGTKMFQHSLKRITKDLEQLVDGGIEEIFFTDSNFGALSADLAKAHILADIRQRKGRPLLFCTSWSKNHGDRVRQIVRLLHRNGLIEHYTLALQTMTPAALEASHRTNMALNQFKKIAEEMAHDEIPVTSELIWGLPGDNLTSFKKNLDLLTSIFPSIAIYGYTLLPGTEFFEHRTEYNIQTVRVKKFANWKLDYVIATQTFNREEGVKGYFLVAAHTVLNRGNIIPLTTRFIAMHPDISVSDVLEHTMNGILMWMASDGSNNLSSDGIDVYSERDRIYRKLLAEREKAFKVLRTSVEDALRQFKVDQKLVDQASLVLDIDEARCPYLQPQRTSRLHTFDFPADLVFSSLNRMTLPEPLAFTRGKHTEITVVHPARMDDVPSTSLPAGTIRGQHMVIP
jgi:radical SAM superfamily enzyme YgiQ (UPF0313 family)